MNQVTLTEITSTHTGSRRTQWLQKISLGLCFAVCVCHVLSLTLVITFDGNWYVHLADILGTDKFPADWDFLRTPLFPLLLKLSFWLFGRQAMAVIGLQTGLGFAGIYFLTKAITTFGRPVETTIAAVLLSAYPMLITYEHLLLTEVGTFFFLSLFVYLVTRRDRRSVLGATTLAIVITAGYYHRSSLLYLAPLLGVVYVLPDIREALKQSGSTVWYQRFGTAIEMLVIIVTVPFFLAYPWQHNSAVSIRNGQSVLLYGLVRSAVLPPDDPILGAAAPIYRRAIEQSISNGKLPDTGLQNGSEYAVAGMISQYGASASSIFFRVIRTHPARYLQGVGRNLALFLGFGGFANDNAHFREAVLSSRGRIDKGPSWLPPLGDEFRRNTAVSFTSQALRIGSPFFDWLVPFGVVATVIAFGIGIWRMDATMLAFTATPLAFIVLHAVILMSQDRMAMPAYPFFLANLVMLPAWLKSAGPSNHGKATPGQWSETHPGGF